MNVKALCFIGVLCVFLPAKAIATDNPSQLDMNQSANINNSNWSTITHTYNVDNSPNMDYYIGIHSQLLKMPQISQLNCEQLAELTAKYTEIVLNHQDGVYDNIPDDQFSRAVLDFLSKYSQDHFLNNNG